MADNIRRSGHQWECYYAEEAHNPLLTNCYEVECWCKQKHRDFMSEVGKGDASNQVSVICRTSYKKCRILKWMIKNKMKENVDKINFYHHYHHRSDWCGLHCVLVSLPAAVAVRWKQVGWMDLLNRRVFSVSGRMTALPADVTHSLVKDVRAVRWTFYPHVLTVFSIPPTYISSPTAFSTSAPICKSC